MTSPATLTKRLHGHLKLKCSRDKDGKSFLREKAYRSPIHISKPYWTGECLLLNVMSPTAGLLEGDRVDIDVLVESGTSLTLSNPSALRIHKMNQGHAIWVQKYEVQGGAFLESNPEWLILQNESALVQQTELRVVDGADLFFVECIAPGRIAHKESFAYRSFSNRLKLFYDGKLAAMEQFNHIPSESPNHPWQKSFDTPFFISIYACSKQLHGKKEFAKRIHELNSDNLYIGASQLQNSPCWNIRILSSNSIDAKKALAETRALFHEIAQRKVCDLRRT